MQTIYDQSVLVELVQNNSMCILKKMNLQDTFVFAGGSLYYCLQNQDGIDYDNVAYTWGCDDGWAGVIPGDVREEVLENCKQALAKYYTEKQATTQPLVVFISLIKIMLPHNP